MIRVVLTRFSEIIVFSFGGTEKLSVKKALTCIRKIIGNSLFQDDAL